MVIEKLVKNELVGKTVEVMAGQRKYERGTVIDQTRTNLVIQFNDGKTVAYFRYEVQITHDGERVMRRAS